MREDGDIKRGIGILRGQSKSIRYVLLFVSVAIIWGSSFLLVKDLVGDDVPVFLFLSIRFLVGFFALYILKRGRRESRISRREIRHGVFMGGIVFLAFILQTFGAVYTTAAKNGMLTGLYVIMVPLFLLALSRRWAWKPLLDAGICLVGMAVLFDIFGNLSAVNLGDILTILCAAAFSVQFIFLEKYSASLNTWNYTVVMLISVSMLAALASLVFEHQLYSDLVLSGKHLLVIVFLGIFSTAYAYWVQTFVQTKLSAVTVSLIACLESVFAVLFSLLFGFETASPHLLFGSLIILVSMVSSVVWAGKKKETAGVK